MRRLVAISLLGIALQLIAMGVYLRTTLSGEIDFHILSAEMFGVPKGLADRGIQPFYYSAGVSGWDGQFYYYIANDLFARADTPQHVDANAYRYQRPGLSLFAKLVSSLALRSWVSPSFYYASNIILVFLGTMAAGAILLHYGANPAWSLLWSAGVGTQLTVLNGLPDAAADAFLLIGIASLFSKLRAVAALSLSFCVLSREIYVAFPVLFAFFSLLNRLRNNVSGDSRLRLFRLWCFAPETLLHAVPVATFFAWQLFVRVKFGVAPSEQAINILGWPLLAWFKYFWSGLLGNHLLLGPGEGARQEAISLCLFLAILLTALTCALNALVIYWRGKDVVGQATASTAAIFAVTYFFFGSVVMMHYTGYMKAATIFFFLIPLFAMKLTSNAESRFWSKPLSIWRFTASAGQFAAMMIVLVTFVYTDIYYWKNRILPKQDFLFNRYANRAAVTTGGEADCLNDYHVEMRIISRQEDPYPQTLFNKLFPPSHTSLVWVEITNRTGRRISSLRGKGGVNISYQWISPDGKSLAMDGIRTAIEGLDDGGKAVVPLVVKYPEAAGEYLLQFSPVQEGCAWFYRVNPASGVNEKISIR